MNRLYQHKVIIFLILVSMGFVSFAQSLTTGQEVRYNPISTAVPFLTISPDSRHSAMGDVGAATSPDANAQFWNPSKFAFTEKKFGIALSYTPWLRELVSDFNLANLSGYYKIDQNQTIGSSLRYFSMGNIQLTDLNGTNVGVVKPNEFAYDLSYSRKLSENFSGGITMRYIRSDLSGGIGLESYTPGNAFTTDVSFYYHRNLGDENLENSISAGVNFSNIGSKISYDDGKTKEFLPANLRLGTTYTRDLDPSHSLSVSLDLNKLLVPTPVYSSGTSGQSGTVVLPGNDSNTSVLTAIFNSFSDAPGGFKEEMQEINVSTGIEYWYKHQFAVRTGYFNENANKGNRKFFSAGMGVKMNTCSIDLSYLVPVRQNNPLANTLRFTLLFDVDSFFKKKEAEPKAEPTQTVPVEATNK